MTFKFSKKELLKINQDKNREVLTITDTEVLMMMLMTNKRRLRFKDMS